MYKKHSLLVVIVSVIVFFLSERVQADYSTLSEDAMTLVSIVTAVYITVPSFMVGSPYADKLKRTSDSKKPGMSQLGTIREYLRCGMFFSIVTILICSMYSLKLVAFGKICNNKVDLDQLFSSFSCSIFAVNILFLWLIFKLTLATMMNAAVYDNQGE